MMKIPSAEASSCMEGLTTVDVTCRRSEADQGCWIACQQKHGPTAEAWCRSVTLGLPAQVCMCTYPCSTEYLGSGVSRPPLKFLVKTLPLIFMVILLI
ncbi:hypothetical protein PHJA_001376000 [Phtheirospermum japonicum]|uniref:Uncharacterized protein n=1 Tax=Phtheirospermum japonicum TaxID=374723 RepID=A0A830C029_9LAMI|nr:hypothetical protein PHJA_001376000 [Phtheirospermum japonicum]